MTSSRMLTVLCFFLASARVDAAYIVYEFEGTLDHQAFGGPIVPVGSPFSGLFSFEEQGNRTDEPDNFGVTSYYFPIFIELTVGETTITSTLGQAEVENAVTNGTDDFIILVGTEFNSPFSETLNGHAIRLFTVNLGGFRNTFSSSDYPRSMDITTFQGGSINLLSGPLNATLLSGSRRGGVENLMEFTISQGMICDTPTCQIPEPSSVALSICALAVLAATRWKATRRRAREPAREGL